MSDDLINRIRKKYCKCPIVRSAEGFDLRGWKFFWVLIKHTKKCKLYAECGCLGYINSDHKNIIKHENCKISRRRYKRKIRRFKKTKKKLDNLIYNKERAIAYWFDVNRSKLKKDTFDLYLYMTVAGRHTRTLNLTKKLPLVARAMIVQFLGDDNIHNQEFAMTFLEHRYAILFTFPKTISYHYNYDDDFEQESTYDNGKSRSFTLPNDYCLKNQNKFVTITDHEYFFNYFVVKYNHIICSSNIYNYFYNARYHMNFDFSFEINLPDHIVQLIVEYCKLDFYYKKKDDCINLTKDKEYKNNIMLNI